MEDTIVEMTDNAQYMRDISNRLNRVYIYHPAHSRGTPGAQCLSLTLDGLSWHASTHIRVPWRRRGPSPSLADIVRIGGGGLEELWCELDEPLGLDREHVVAVFARGADDLVIDAPLGRVPVQRARRVDVHRGVLGERPVAPEPRIARGGVPEKTRADRPSHAIAVASRADHVVLVPVHDPQQLLAHVPRVAHVFRLDEVVRAPRVRELARLPTFVRREQRQVVALCLVELGLLGVRLVFLVARSVEDARYGEHRDDRQDLFGALEFDRRDEHLGQLRLHRKIGHLAAEACQRTVVVQRGERMKGLQGSARDSRGGRVHKVEVQEVVDAHRLEHQDGVRQVRTLDVRNRVGRHLVAIL